MKYPKTFKRYILNLSNIFRRYTFATEFLVHLKFHESEDGPESTNDEQQTAASIDIYLPYFEAKIHVYPRLLRYYRKKRYGECADVICHEYAHILIRPIEVVMRRKKGISQSVVDNTTEQQVQRITNIIMAVSGITDWSPEQVRKAGK